MNHYAKIFNADKVVLPVVHLKDYEQGRRQIEIAQKAGAHGVWLIENLKLAPFLRRDFPDMWMGVNDLRFHPSESGWGTFDEVHWPIMAHSKGNLPCITGIWTDNAGLADPKDKAMTEMAESRFELMPYRRIGTPGHETNALLYFGGFEFKYQKQSRDLDAAMKNITDRDVLHVVCTSGPATAKAPDLDKIKYMHSWFGPRDVPIAIASGLTPDNVGVYSPYADFFMVASGVSKSWYEFDPGKLSDFVKAVSEK